MTHICVGNLTIICSDNGLSPSRRQAIIWTIAGILLIGLVGTIFSEILIECIYFHKENAFEKVVCKMTAILSRLQCVNADVLLFSRLILTETAVPGRETIRWRCELANAHLEAMAASPITTATPTAVRFPYHCGLTNGQTEGGAPRWGYSPRRTTPVARTNSVSRKSRSYPLLTALVVTAIPVGWTIRLLWRRFMNLMASVSVSWRTVGPWMTPNFWSLDRTIACNPW